MLHIKTVYNGAAAAMAKGMGATTRMVQFAFRNAYEETLDFWHKKIRPKHFQRSAIAEYGYAARTAGYEGRKKADVGHRRPLVYSGKSEEATERNYIRVSARSASLHMDAGNLLWRPGGINMREELLATTDEDEAAMARVFEREVTQVLRDWPQTHTENIA